MIPTSTLLPPSPIPTITSSITTTTQISCDPFSTDYCITDGHLILQRPIQPPANDLIDPIYGYGSTASGTREPHHGVEFSNPSGTPVYAAAQGTVIFAGSDEEAVYAPWGDFYGNLVVIEHSDDLFTLYAHLSRVDVLVDQKVLAGDKIGEVGRTGGAIGSHLHFEVRRGDVEDYFATQNPELWLIPAKDINGIPFGTLMIFVVDGDGNLIKNANLTIGYYSDPSQGPNQIYYVTPYSPDMLLGEENATLGGLPSGHYRIAVEMKGTILERWVEVESGKLTQAVFAVK
jgi:murein DD-endopeptidase MepM/ murein hydrolase activator NlpD